MSGLPRTISAVLLRIVSPLLFAASCSVPSICAEQLQGAAAASVQAPLMSTAAQQSLPEVKGDVLMAQGHYVAALTAYQSVPIKTAVVLNKTGMAYHHLFALEEARKDYEAALKLNPHYAEALNNLGAVYHAQHQYGMAARAYKRAIKYSPHIAVAYCNLGTAYFAEGHPKQGIKAYQKAYAADPLVFEPGHGALVESGSSAQQRAAVNYSMAKLYAQAGKQQEALQALQKAFDSGFRDRRRLLEDTEFASLRHTAAFEHLLAGQQWQ